MIHHAHLGKVVHHLKNGRVREFTPKGKIFTVSGGKLAKQNPIERIGQGGYSARLFVGLKVGRKLKWKIADVVKIVWDVRERQKATPDASILAQSGIYKDMKGRRIVEPSVQIIILDFSGQPKEVFVYQMQTLGEALCRELEQETVILEIQNKGVIEDVYTVKA